MSHRRLHNAFPQQPSNNASLTSNDVSPNIMITVLILAIAVILFASLYLLLRFIRRNRHHTTTSLPPSLRKISPELSSLPLFTFNRLTAKNTGDCAVCLSKFDNDDVLRLLPICCHAFHAVCIDTWLSSNLTCPLCRSPIHLSESELIGKFTGERRSGSFRVEIGNVSNRNRDVTAATNSGEVRLSYSLGGDFDYIINTGDDAIAELSMTSSELCKQNEQEGQEVVVAEVCTRGVGVGWLREYLSSSSSRTESFRSSGRYFTGSSASRRSTTVVENELVEFEEVSRLGDEIGGFFKFFTGV